MSKSYSCQDYIEFCQMEIDEPLSELDRATLAGMYLMYCVDWEINDLTEKDVKYLVEIFTITYNKAKERIV